MEEFEQLLAKHSRPVSPDVLEDPAHDPQNGLAVHRRDQTIDRTPLIRHQRIGWRIDNEHHVGPLQRTGRLVSSVGGSNALIKEEDFGRLISDCPDGLLERWGAATHDYPMRGGEDSDYLSGKLLRCNDEDRNRRGIKKILSGSNKRRGNQRIRRTPSTILHWLWGSLSCHANSLR
jgi:hypothetical protein